MRNLIVVLTVLFASVMFLAKPAAAATRLSGISVQSACNNQYVGQGSKAYLLSYNVFGWRCARFPATGYYGAYPFVNGVDLNRECRRIYGSAAYASYTSYGNPYSWGCYR